MTSQYEELRLPVAYGHVPDEVDRVIIHQFDPCRPAPGGIDTCLRGIIRNIPSGTRFAIVGVDAGGDVPGRRLGEWEEYEIGSGRFWFIPVAKMDRGHQNRIVPHSMRLISGVLRYYRKLPKSTWFQAHRLEAAWALRHVIGERNSYFIHTQETGLTGKTSDSFWRFAGGIQRRLERSVVRRADHVVVFNDQYAQTVREWNPRVQSSPTWFDPQLIVADDLPTRDPFGVIWVGRLEVPKDPILAIKAFKVLAEEAPSEPWHLHVVGSGTRLSELEDVIGALPTELRGRVTLHGRTAPARVAELMALASVFLMTSHPGYEGFPRALVEALASGLPAVVTSGSDTGGLISESENGFVTSRDPDEIAQKLKRASKLDRATARATVARLSAPTVIDAIYAP